MAGKLEAKDVNAEALRAALQDVIDPEVGMNIVDLGLIYGVSVEAGQVKIDMTMTSPACPMGDMMLDEIEAVLKRVLPKGWEFEIELVWEPPWSPALMSETARTQLGWEE
ncbi:MAG: metal-sulfur cluster assembly factor [Rhodocyclaceae bacterium]|nr:metal-sulfur cluster assembly factor [Rhodocyclaceae bacterium]